MPTDLAALVAPDRPALERAELDTTSADMLSAQARHGPVVLRVVRGSRSATLPAFFDELAAALQLPGYFGGNWSALEDCLRDLAEQEPAGTVVIVKDAHKLLAEEDEDALHTFLGIAAGADEEAREAGAGRIRVVLTEVPASLWRLEPRLEGFPLELPLVHLAP